MLPLTEGEQQLLLQIARRAIEEGVPGERRIRLEPGSGSLCEPRGAFVTLRLAHALRGCIGHVEAELPLCETVAECAVAASQHDPRFAPVTAEDLAELRIEISVLSPLADILPGEIEIGRHGLLISQGFRRGLLLPQVALEWKWDRERFLAETCCKAGLARDAWRHGARIQAFTTQAFAEQQDERLFEMPNAAGGAPAVK
ncbi:MAG TPA: AmmeMemoRadiSam system protein A [Terriglobia bacterium]|nr:AmmeMemoRadiSam system protein A [Terriglobia bacterium]